MSSKHSKKTDESLPTLEVDVVKSTYLTCQELLIANVNMNSRLARTDNIIIYIS